MSVTAKFYVKSITSYSNGVDQAVTQKDVSLQAVNGDKDENKSWSKWTPSGEARLCITNPEAFNQFKEGQVVMMTLEPVEPA